MKTRGDCFAGLATTTVGKIVLPTRKSEEPNKKNLFYRGEIKLFSPLRFENV